MAQKNRAPRYYSVFIAMGSLGGEACCSRYLVLPQKEHTGDGGRLVRGWGMLELHNISGELLVTRRAPSAQVGYRIFLGFFVPFTHISYRLCKKATPPACLVLNWCLLESAMPQTHGDISLSLSVCATQ